MFWEAGIAAKTRTHGFSGCKTHANAWQCRSMPHTSDSNIHGLLFEPLLYIASKLLYLRNREIQLYKFYIYYYYPGLVFVNLGIQILSGTAEFS